MGTLSELVHFSLLVSVVRIQMSSLSKSKDFMFNYSVKLKVTHLNSYWMKV